MGPQERGDGLGLGFALGWFLVLGFLSISPFLFLIETNTQLGEFKIKFEFTTSTQTTKAMHQHVCNNTIKSKENFNYLCTKIRLNALLAQ